MAEFDSLKYDIADDTLGGTRIKVIGVGGGGSNAVGRMIAAGVHGVEFYVMNTDAQALRASKVPNRLTLGARITHGLGAGSDPEVGRQAALEDTDKIIEILEGSDMVFVAAGLGGGTGTGAAPVVAALAKEMGALTVAVVTRPFSFEGPRRKSQAERGLAELHATVDTVISIPNDRLVELVPPNTSFFEAFRMADDVLRQGVQGISDIITTPGLINRDFADIRNIMLGMGFAMMGTATARGENAATEAAKAAIQCPLLEEGGLRGAKAILLNIAASGNLTLHQMHEACSLIRESTGNPDVQINFGLVPDDSLNDEVRITVIATGFPRENLPAVEARPVQAQISRSKAVPTLPAQPAQIPEPQFTSQPIIQSASRPMFGGPPLETVKPYTPEEVRASYQQETQDVDAERVEDADDAPLDLDFEPIQESRPAPAAEIIDAEPEPPAPPPQRPQPPADDIDFEDLDTPAIFKRERKLFS
jgi:cell division protein FtsZ